MRCASARPTMLQSIAVLAGGSGGGGSAPNLLLLLLSQASRRAGLGAVAVHSARRADGFQARRGATGLGERRRLWGFVRARRTCVGCARAWRALQAARPVTRARYRAVPRGLRVQLSAASAVLRQAAWRVIYAACACCFAFQPARCCTKRCWPSWAAPATYSWTRRRSARPQRRGRAAARGVPEIASR